jgi:hypothetical protein
MYVTVGTYETSLRAISTSTALVAILGTGLLQQDRRILTLLLEGVNRIAGAVSVVDGAVENSTVIRGVAAGTFRMTTVIDLIRGIACRTAYRIATRIGRIVRAVAHENQHGASEMCGMSANSRGGTATNDVLCRGSTTPISAQRASQSRDQGDWTLIVEA